MASRSARLHYGKLIQNSRSTTLGTRRTISYTQPLYAENGKKGTAEIQKEKKTESDEIDSESRQSGWMSSVRELLFSRAQPGEKPVRKPMAPPPPMQRQGTLSDDSIFAGESAGAEISDETQPTEKKRSTQLSERQYSSMQKAIDPKPEARKRWERKMIIREIRKRGRMTKQEIIMATERESLVKSHWFKTSIKKLTPLARQIAGKNIDEAILQMQFSKKKVAKDVMEHLKLAKNTAIVRHGMGLGKVGGGDQETKSEPITVIMKDGEKKTITDPSSIYIAQAWVNRGPFDTGYDHRARGKINILRLPYTGLSVLLKEEKTRIREWKDRESKALRQRKSMLWVQLPDRPISSQNQYYSW